MSIHDWFRRRRKHLRVGLSLFALYVGTYLALSAAGQYHPLPSGKIRWSFGFAVTDRSLWQPQGLYLALQLGTECETRIRGDVTGCFFAPLIYLDRAYLHPTVY